MKDYSKVKFVKPSITHGSVTLDKVYPTNHEFHDVFSLNDDEGHSILVVASNRKSFVVHDYDYRYGWIPCDENGKELYNGK